MPSFGHFVQKLGDFFEITSTILFMMILRKEFSSKIYIILIIQIKKMKINKEKGVKMIQSMM